MYAVIIKDHIDCTKELGDDFLREGKVILGEGDRPDGLVDVRVLDDDRIPYFDLLATDDDDVMEYILIWCMSDTGATILQRKNDAGEWEDYTN